MSNELTTYTPSPMVSLVEIRRDNVRFPRLHSYPQDIAHRMMTAIVIRANEYFGQKPEMAEVEQIAWDLYTELMNDDEGLRTRNITMEEIHRAIRKAATGQGAEFYGKVSFYFLYKCIMHYVKNEVMQANTQMLRLAESGRMQEYRQKTELIVGAAVTKMVEHSKID